MINQKMESRLEYLSEDMQQDILTQFRNNIEYAEKNYQNALRDKEELFYKEKVMFKQTVLHDAITAYEILQKGDLNELSEHIDRSYEKTDRFFKNLEEQDRKKKTNEPGGLVGFIRRFYR